jgi:hypothetical protein
MTNEEMAAALRRAGWRVQPPLTKENCRHPRKFGSGSIGSDGASRMTWYCPDCYASHDFEYKPGSIPIPVMEFWK